MANSGNSSAAKSFLGRNRADVSARFGFLKKFKYWQKGEQIFADRLFSAEIASTTSQVARVFPLQKSRVGRREGVAGEKSRPPYSCPRCPHVRYRISAIPMFGKEDTTSRREPKLDWPPALSVRPSCAAVCFAFSGSFPRFSGTGTSGERADSKFEDYRTQVQCAFFRSSSASGAEWARRNYERVASRMGPVQG